MRTQALITMPGHLSGTDKLYQQLILPWGEPRKEMGRRGPVLGSQPEPPAPTAISSEGRCKHERLRNTGPNLQLGIRSRSSGSHSLIVIVTKARHPGHFFILDLKKKRWSGLFSGHFLYSVHYFLSLCPCPAVEMQAQRGRAHTPLRNAVVMVVSKAVPLS